MSKKRKPKTPAEIVNAAMKKKNGRPRSEINQEQFESLCAIHCTLLETCAVLKVTDKTLDKWCKETYGKSFSEVFDIFAANGRASVRRKQFQLAMAGNVKLLEILGQNLLGQEKRVKNTNVGSLHDEIMRKIHGEEE